MTMRSHSPEKLDLLTAILDNAVEGIVVCNNDGELTYFNQKTRELHGLPPEPIPVDEWSSYYSLFQADGKTPLAPSEIPLIRALNEGEIRDVRMVIARPGKAPVQLLVTGHALYSPEGKKLGAMVNMLDITQNLEIQEAMEKVAERSEARFQTIFEQAPFSIQLLATDGKTILVNPAWKKLWGFSEEFIQSYILKEYNLLKDPLLASHGFTPLIEKGFSGEIVRIPEIHYDPKELDMDGIPRWVRSILYPLKNPDGSVREIVLIHTDVTSEYQARTEKEKLLGELNQERNRLDFLDHVTSLLLTTLDYNEIILQVASAAIPQLADGCMVDLLEGDKIKRLITRHANPEIEKIMGELQLNFPPQLNSPHPGSRVIRSGEAELLKVLDHKIIKEHTLNEQHAELIARIGVRSHIAVPLKIRGRIIGAISFLITTVRPGFDENDLTLAIELSRRAAIAIENARLYSESQSANQQREEFISIASHELKTPITSLKLQLEAISRSISKSKLERIDHEYLKKFSASSIRQLDRLTRLVEDMLDISRISTGKLALNMRVVDLTETVKEVLPRFSDQLAEMKVELNSELADDCIVYCDPFRIEQVIINLISNALKYGLKKPILVKLEKIQQQVKFSVIDQGPGIAEEDQERIFRRFERGSDPLMAGGLGLGLYISREIIEQHEGKIFVSSQIGHGSTFSFTLPLENLT